MEPKLWTAAAAVPAMNSRRCPLFNEHANPRGRALRDLRFNRHTLGPTDHSGFPHERAHYDRFWRKTAVAIVNE
jgi:hypothetical protein